MSYGIADTNPKVGYRPYHHSSPRRAASLSGLDGEAAWKLGQVRAFDPWILHKDTAGYARGLYGIGQVRPFDQHPGGWLLHGLGDVEPESPAGTILTYSGTLTAGPLFESDLATLGNVLSQNWNLQLRSYEVTSHGMLGSPSFRLTVYDGIGHANAIDVQAIIDHEVITNIGDKATSSIGIISKPGAGGAPGPPPGDHKDPMQWLMDNAIWIGLAIGAMVVVPPLLKKI